MSVFLRLSRAPPPVQDRQRTTRAIIFENGPQGIWACSRVAHTRSTGLGFTAPCAPLRPTAPPHPPVWQQVWAVNRPRGRLHSSPLDAAWMVLIASSWQRRARDEGGGRRSERELVGGAIADF